ncbi:MAG: YkgJ family cysteine cluster protein [Spirochaetales bacterium]|nr:YkgJ family cysteine cluster protein [Spirochaetales bacterium]
MNDLVSEAGSVLHGTVRLGTESYQYGSSFARGLSFRCLPDCGLCCRTYRVPLTELDLDRLREVADPEACPGIRLTESVTGGGIRAFMENGRAEGCCYLDGNARCSVYGHRPLYCRTYPLIRDVYEQLEMSVDHTCPGVGQGDPLTTGQIEEAFRIEALERPGALQMPEASARYRVIRNSLRAMGVYAEPELMRSVCMQLIERGLSFRWVSRVSAYFEEAAGALAGSMAGAGNITDPQAAARIVEGIVEKFGREPAAAAGHGGNESGDTRREHPQDSELTDGAAERLAGYLAEWIRRQALLRFVHATALARPGWQNVLSACFDFLADAARSILADAASSVSRGGGRSVTARDMLEAIRANEGPLRSSCASVVSRY